MYILNPTKENLDSWYKCGFIISDYLLKNGLNYIHKNEYYFYYVKTEDWKHIHSKMPFWIRIFELL